MNIEIRNLNKNFGKTQAVKNLNFVIKEFKTIGLLGPNGCGKTTTIGMLLGLIEPSSGEILIDGKKIIKSNFINILSKMNFASPYIELPKKLTVEQNLEVYARLYGIKNVTSQVEKVSSDLGLTSYLKKKSGELSSGQKNRVALAKSLINDPEILFLDEPTASLDPDIGDFVREYLENYKLKNKVTVLLASHNMSEVERLCDEVIMMKSGSIIDKGTCSDLIKRHGRQNLEETFLKIVRNNI